jgi:predicted nuclease of predicted toxin-antitoxin system
VTFLIDAQLPPALASWLIQQGHAAQHVDDLGLRNADDIVIWNHASESAQSSLQKTKTH